MIEVVLGGQFGSEGKGEFVAYRAEHADSSRKLAVVRTGGPNAGHTVTRYDGIGEFASSTHMKMRMIPAGWVNPNADLYLAAGGLINLHVLTEELKQLQREFGWAGEFYIDRMATVISRVHEVQEQDRGMRQSIGSTTEGIGAARADKIMRSARVASQIDLDLPDEVVLVDVASELNELIDEHDGSIIIESTQGFGLSLELSGNYPYATSANITPGHLMGECGLSPQLPAHVIAVMRTFPIRVAGNSGPMYRELSWNQMATMTEGRTPEDGERTTVTNLVRRIGMWDPDLAERMAMVCRPDAIALSFLDYAFPRLADCDLVSDIESDDEVMTYLHKLSSDARETPIAWVSTGPGKWLDLEDAVIL